MGWQALTAPQLATLCPITPFACPDGAAWAGFDTTATLTATGVTGTYREEFNTSHEGTKDGTSYTADPDTVYPTLLYLMCSGDKWQASVAIDINSLTSDMMSTNASSGEPSNAVDHNPSTLFTVTNTSGTNHLDADLGASMDWLHMRLRGPDLTDHTVLWSDSPFTSDDLTTEKDRPEVFYQDFFSGTMGKVFNSPPRSARYIRILRESAGTASFNLREIKIFDDTWTDLMPGATITSTIGGWSGATLDEIRDGTTSSGGPSTATFASTDYIEIDLGAVYDIVRIQAWKGTTTQLGIRTKTTAFTGGETDYTNTGTPYVLSHVAIDYLLFGITTGSQYVRVQTLPGIDIRVRELEVVDVGDDLQITARWDYEPPGAVAGVPSEGYIGVSHTSAASTLLAELEVSTA